MCVVEPRQPYLYFDLTAGPGIVDGREGSPLLFIREAERLARPWRAAFFEASPRTARGLQAQVAAFDSARVVATDYNEGLEVVMQLATRSGTRPVGLAYVDPNGVIDLTGLRRLCRERFFERIDVLIHLSATTYKRVRCCRNTHGTAYIREEMESLGKRQVQVRQPREDQQWCMALLTNWANFPRLRRWGFRAANSPEGEAILDRINFTEKELREIGPRGQLSLW